MATLSRKLSTVLPPPRRDDANDDAASEIPGVCPANAFRMGHDSSGSRDAWRSSSGNPRRPRIRLANSPTNCSKVRCLSAEVERPTVGQLSENWRLDRLATVDRNILRLAIYELRSGTAPVKVVIDEALELAKKFSSAESPGFLNGILDAAAKQLESASLRE